MTILIISVGCLLGIGLGFLIPTIPYSVSNYLAIAIVAALDSVFGGIASNIRKVFDIKVFVSGFFVNAIFAMFLAFVGQKLNVDIYLAAIIVFVGRIFLNIGIIRRYYLEKIETKAGEKFGNKNKKNEKNNEQ